MGFDVNEVSNEDNISRFFSNEIGNVNGFKRDKRVSALFHSFDVFFNVAAPRRINLLEIIDYLLEQGAQPKPDTYSLGRYHAFLAASIKSSEDFLSSLEYKVLSKLIKAGYNPAFFGNATWDIPYINEQMVLVDGISEYTADKCKIVETYIEYPSPEGESASPIYKVHRHYHRSSGSTSETAGYIYDLLWKSLKTPEVAGAAFQRFVNYINSGEKVYSVTMLRGKWQSAQLFRGLQNVRVFQTENESQGLHLSVYYKHVDKGGVSSNLEQIRQVYIDTSREVHINLGSVRTKCRVTYDAGQFFSETETQNIWKRVFEPRVVVQDFYLRDVLYAVIEQLGLNTEGYDMKNVELVTRFNDDDGSIKERVETFDLSENGDKETPWVGQKITIKVPKL